MFTRFKFEPINAKLESVVHRSQHIRTEDKPEGTAKPDVPAVPTEPK
jgi:hypothetical protein